MLENHKTRDHEFRPGLSVEGSSGYRGIVGGTVTHCNREYVITDTLLTVFTSISGLDQIYRAFCWERPRQNMDAMGLHKCFAPHVFS
jgi:hypothetical protein